MPPPTYTFEAIHVSTLGRNQIYHSPFMNLGVYSSIVCCVHLKKSSDLELWLSAYACTCI